MAPGTTRSGLPGKRARSRYRIPACQSARRSRSSGAVSFVRTRAICSDLDRGPFERPFMIRNVCTSALHLARIIIPYINARFSAMTERKTETVNLRFTPSMKELLRFMAAREHRTQANMIECIVLDYCERNGIDVRVASNPSATAEGSHTSNE